uniref:Uncharacterized protein n=1 Tax=Clastoptera arizonana TaxID=38151 RepID=A0A1B6CXF8_9HEMI
MSCDNRTATQEHRANHNDESKQEKQFCLDRILSGLDDFPKQLLYQYYPPHHHVEGYDVLPMESKHIKEIHNNRNFSFLNNNKYKVSWQKFKDGLPVSYLRIVEMPNERNYHFMNYKLRYIHPEVASSWRQELRTSKHS